MTYKQLYIQAEALTLTRQVAELCNELRLLTLRDPDDFGYIGPDGFWYSEDSEGPDFAREMCRELLDSIVGLDNSGGCSLCNS